MTVALHGSGVSRGIAIGKVHILERGQKDIPEYNIEPDQVTGEIKRLQSAVAAARQQLGAIREHIPSTTTADISSFIDAHLLMLEDVALTQEAERLIVDRHLNAEWALKLQRDALIAVFDEMGDAYLRTRMDDIDHVVNRIQRSLRNQSPLPHETPDGRLKGCVVLADDLTPADTVLLQNQGIAAFAMERGGPTSHTAILARSLSIPAVVGLHEARRYIQAGDQVILDGSSGVILIGADGRSLKVYQERQERERIYYTGLARLREAPARTLDGTHVELMANIELPRDFDAVRVVGAAGVGLYRTEFLFMNRERLPDEDEHLRTYISVLDALEGLPLTIRTLDLGADKQADAAHQPSMIQTNPALGLRAIRLCLKDPSLFVPQLRAILRASAYGNVRLLLPMVSNIQEIDQVLDLIGIIREELDNNGVSYNKKLPIGCMIEVPAAAICADIFANRLDFLSIGTNDLIQYTMAIDRVNDEVNYLYDPLHPAVLRLISSVLQAGRAADIPTAMCGEMAGDKHNTRLLLGLGLREFSVHPANLLEVKEIITASNIDHLQGLAQQALCARTSADVGQIMERMNSGLF